MRKVISEFATTESLQKTQMLHANHSQVTHDREFYDNISLTKTVVN